MCSRIANMEDKSPFLNLAIEDYHKVWESTGKGHGSIKREVLGKSALGAKVDSRTFAAIRGARGYGNNMSGSNAEINVRT